MRIYLANLLHQLRIEKRFCCRSGLCERQVSKEQEHCESHAYKGYTDCDATLMSMRSKRLRPLLLLDRVRS